MDFKNELENYDIQKLISIFNKDVGHNGWTSSRAQFVAALRGAFLKSGYDCSDFITKETMSLKYPLKVEGNRILQIRA